MEEDNMSEQEIDQINVKLRYLSDDIYHQETKIKQQERIQDQVFELQHKNEQLFDNIFSCWHKEPEMHHFMMAQHDQYQHEKYQLQDELDTEYEALLKEKQQLMNQEETYYQKRHELSLEEEKS